MSGNRKRVLALLVGALTSAFIGLLWGVVLRGFGEPMVDCVKDGVAGGGGTFVTALAVIMLFPFKDDPGTGGQALSAQIPPGTPSA